MMRAVDIAKLGSDRKKVKEIYMRAFPREERMPFWMMRAMAKMQNTEFLAFYEEELLCGFVYMAVAGNIVFVMFFAVEESLRCRGYGSRILAEIQAQYPGQKIVISIEKCDGDASDLEKRLRRKRFYLRNGFQETGFRIELEKQEQEIIIKNGTFDSREFSSFLKKYSNGTLRPPIWKADAKNE